MATRKKSSGKKKASKRYGKKASKKVQRSMEEMKSGSLRSGRSRKKVTSRKQAIAIGLSEARREGGKVPPRKKGSKKTSKKGSKKRSAKRGSR
jgi:hypothetical protein